MVINKFGGYKNEATKPIKLNLDLMTYDILCKYILQSGSYV